MDLVPLKHVDCVPAALTWVQDGLVTPALSDQGTAGLLRSAHKDAEKMNLNQTDLEIGLGALNKYRQTSCGE